MSTSPSRWSDSWKLSPSASRFVARRWAKGDPWAEALGHRGRSLSGLTPRLPVQKHMPLAGLGTASNRAW